jgi:hypothetical protein
MDIGFFEQKIEFMELMELMDKMELMELIESEKRFWIVPQDI